MLVFASVRIQFIVAGVCLVRLRIVFTLHIKQPLVFCPYLLYSHLAAAARYVSHVRSSTAVARCGSGRYAVKCLLKFFIETNTMWETYTAAASVRYSYCCRSGGGGFLCACHRMRLTRTQRMPLFLHFQLSMATTIPKPNAGLNFLRLCIICIISHKFRTRLHQIVIFTMFILTIAAAINFIHIPFIIWLNIVFSFD